MHVEEGTSVQGYRSCTCGTLVLESSWHLMEGLCFDCFAQGKSRHVHISEVWHQGRRINLPNLPGVKKKRSSRGKGATHGIRKAAKLAALKRLGDIYPDMFAMIYAEERLKRGLEPVPLRTYEGVAARGAATVDDAWFYDALSEAGEPSDGTS